MIRHIRFRKTSTSLTAGVVFAVAAVALILSALPGASEPNSAGRKYVYDIKDSVRYRYPTHANDLVIDRSESAGSEVFVVILEPGESPPTHVHHDTEQVFYVMRGAGELYIGKAGEERFPVRTGDVVRIPPHTYHRIQSDSRGSLVYFCVDCFPNGKPTAEPTFDSHIEVFCREQGWDLKQVKETGRKQKESENRKRQ